MPIDEYFACQCQMKVKGECKSQLNKNIYSVKQKNQGHFDSSQMKIQQQDGNGLVMTAAPTDKKTSQDKFITNTLQYMGQCTQFCSSFTSADKFQLLDNNQEEQEQEDKGENHNSKNKQNFEEDIKDKSKEK